MSTASRPRPQQSGSVHWPAVALCFLAVLLDGFDTATLAFVIPTAAHQWGVAPAAFTLPLVLTNIGVVLGYLSSGFLGARLNSRRVLMCGVALFAIATLLTALTLPLHSIAVLAVLRLLTGLGLGVVLPSGVALSTNHSAARRRELVSVTVTLGLASGATIGGFLGGSILTAVGVSGVFWIAGLFPLLLVGLMAWSLPSPRRANEEMNIARHEAKLARLFDPSLRANTSLIWAFSFLVFISAYTLTSWGPTLLTGYGFTRSEAPLGLAFLSLGGIVGGIVLIPLAGRFGIARSLVLLPAIGAACMVVAATVPVSHALLLVILGGAGLGVTASQIGQLTLAVAIYPAGTRTTGVGWAAALGRAGSIVGPGIAGALLALALSGKGIILLTAVPVLVAVFCAIALWRRKPNTQVTVADPPGQALNSATSEDAVS